MSMFMATRSGDQSLTSVKRSATMSPKIAVATRPRETRQPQSLLGDVVIASYIADVGKVHHHSVDHHSAYHHSVDHTHCDSGDSGDSGDCSDY